MNAFESANHYISKASRTMNLGPRVERLLLSLEAEHHVTIPIERDNGELAVFSGYRFQHNSPMPAVSRLVTSSGRKTFSAYAGPRRK